MASEDKVTINLSSCLMHPHPLFACAHLPGCNKNTSGILRLFSELPSRILAMHSSGKEDVDGPLGKIWRVLYNLYGCQSHDLPGIHGRIEGKKSYLSCNPNKFGKD